MIESVINYLSTAAEKLRKGRLVAAAITVFIETSQFRENHLYSNSGTAKVLPTDSTRKLIASALRILRSIYRPGYQYRKSGVILLGLQPIEGQTQRLFEDDLYRQDREPMKVMDTLNARYGKQKIRFGMPAKTHTHWKMSREHLSPAYTTNVDQVLRVTAWVGRSRFSTSAVVFRFSSKVDSMMPSVSGSAALSCGILGLRNGKEFGSIYGAFENGEEIQYLGARDGLIHF